MTQYLPSLFGGMLLGVSTIFLLMVNGRGAGISGIVGRLLGGHHIGTNTAFVVGLLTGPLFYAAAFGAFPAMTIKASWPLILIAGVLVGVGTRMGSGCTSGHGILGLARFSKRSLAATLVFLGAAVVTATVTGLWR